MSENMSFTRNSYGTGPNILGVLGDQVTAHAQVVATDDAAIADVGDRRILRAGTIWPANDATAKGVVFQDYDMTEGAQNVALIYVGTINVAKIPAEPTSGAKEALPRVTWIGEIGGGA